MLQGTSALNHEPTKTITTPKLSVNISSNDMLIAGLSHAQPINYGSAVIFNNLLLVANAENINPGVSFAIRAYTVDGNFTGSSNTRIEGTIQGGNFLDLGQTLLYTYNYEDGTGIWRVNRIVSSDGLNWGSTDVLYRGRSENFYIYDTLQTSDTQMYFLESTEAFSGQVNLFSGVKGATWGVTLLDSSIYTTTAYKKLGGHRYSGMDTLLLNGKDITETSGLPSEGVRSITTDGGTVYNKYDLFEIGPNSYEVDISNISKGISYYYLAFTMRDNIYETQGGATVAYSDEIATFVMKSPDLKRWTVPLKVSDFAVAGTFIAAGITPTNNEYTVLHTVSRTEGGDIYKEIIKVKNTLGVSNLDISDDVISYRNNNNQRISLNIGNYR